MDHFNPIMLIACFVVHPSKNNDSFFEGGIMAKSSTVDCFNGQFRSKKVRDGITLNKEIDSN